MYSTYMYPTILMVLLYTFASVSHSGFCLCEHSLPCTSAKGHIACARACQTGRGRCVGLRSLCQTPDGIVTLVLTPVCVGGSALLLVRSQADH